MAPPRGRSRRWIAAALVAALIAAAYLHFDLGRLLTLEQLRASRDALAGAFDARPLAVGLGYFALYVIATAASVPGATVLTLAAGAMMGLGWGVLIVSFASSLGALLAFLAARYLLRDAVQARFGQRLAPINEGMARDGTFYLLTLRLVPLFPFWLVNLLAGLTPIGAARYYVVSQIGMLPATLVYVNAGTRLGGIQSPGDILSPALLGSLVLLGAFPLLARWLVAAVRRRRLYARWPRPRRFDRNLVVVGGGAAGLVTAYIAAAVKAKVTLVEGHKMGGDCLNYGCVPSKALLRSARLAQELRNGAAFGIANAAGEVDFAAVMRRVRGVVRAIEPHDSAERYAALGVEVLSGHARLVSPWHVEVRLADGSTRTLATRSIVIAAGASPIVPAIPGLQADACLTSDTVWSLEQLPRRLAVLGGGPVGCELAQAFARLGSEVTLVEAGPRILGREDADVAAAVEASLRAEGLRLLVAHEAVRVEDDAGGRRLVVRRGGEETSVAYDALLCAVGRRPRVAGYGLEELGIPVSARGTIETDPYLRTRYPNIYAVGDVAGPYQLTHAGAHQAWYGAVNALFGRLRRFRADYAAMPWAVFTDPEVARVGLSEDEARARNIPFEVTRYGIDDLDRAIADGAARGFVKVLTVPGKDRILGAVIVGEQAGELIAEWVLAMKHGLGLNAILATVHAYPTLAEANKYAAGAWKREHAPRRLLAWVERYHAWERG